ncbi:MAG: hypothetical protein AAF184_21220 [Pseudomonadota bacterium]
MSITVTRASLITVLSLGLAAPLALAQEEAYECTDVEPEFYDPDYPYTEQELIALRSEELDRTLGELSYCRGKAGEGEGNGGGSGSGTGTGSGGSGGGSAGSSSGGGPIPSSITGTEPRVLPTLSTSRSREGRETRRAIDQEEIELATPPPPRDQREAPSPGDSGAPAERIRRVDNDDAVAAQIRRAAEAETDPARKQALWNEYYRYTGRRPPDSP